MHQQTAVQVQQLGNFAGVTKTITSRCQDSESDNGEDELILPDDKTVRDLNIRLSKRVNDLGYKLQSIEVLTEDDYVLKIHRLVNKEKTPMSGAPVLIMHGIEGCSASFLTSSGSLPYALAAEKYDVWVANARGTAFSRKHMTLNPKKRKYWDYSFHEIGYYDIPAILSKIKKRTGASEVHFVGVSMGSTAFLVMGSTRGKILEKDVASVSLLGPVACPHNYLDLRSKTKRFLIYYTLKAWRYVGRGDKGTYMRFISLIKYKICRSKGWMGRLCEKMYRSESLGKDIYDHENYVELFPFYPCGASVKSFLHFVQMVKAGKFQKFDYGWRKNQVIYHQPSPEEYNLGSIHKKLYLLVGGEDVHSDKRDVMKLHEELPSSELIIEKLEHFDHRDLLYSKDSAHNEAILGIIASYKKN